MWIYTGTTSELVCPLSGGQRAAQNFANYEVTLHLLSLAAVTHFMDDPSDPFEGSEHDVDDALALQVFSGSTVKVETADVVTVSQSSVTQKCGLQKEEGE